MKVPVVSVDRIGPEDRKRVRTDLRRAQFSALEIDDEVIAITGQVDVVRRIAFKYCGLAPRVRKVEVDGAELDQAYDEPGQFKERPFKQRIARFHGLDRNGRRRLRDALHHAGFAAEIDSDHDEVLAEYVPARKAEMDILVRAALAGSEFGVARVMTR